MQAGEEEGEEEKKERKQKGRCGKKERRTEELDTRGQVKRR